MWYSQLGNAIPMFNHNLQKKQVWIVDPWHNQQVEPQTLIMEKKIITPGKFNVPKKNEKKKTFHGPC